MKKYFTDRKDIANGTKEYMAFLYRRRYRKTGIFGV
ncbi:unknown [Anaerostipes sp. CAG:276]|nr:unknown [Anaerostipes sp. CAG:276]